MCCLLTFLAVLATATDISRKIDTTVALVTPNTTLVDGDIQTRVTAEGGREQHDGKSRYTGNHRTHYLCAICSLFS